MFICARGIEEAGNTYPSRAPEWAIMYICARGIEEAGSTYPSRAPEWAVMFICARGIEEAGSTYPSRAPGIIPGFGRVRVAHQFRGLYCVRFSSLCPQSCVPNVASFSELSILVCPFGFL
jgi:hypothetical protein